MNSGSNTFHKTIIYAVLAAAALIVLSYFFFDRPAAWFAQSFKQTPLHTWAKDLSQLANHTLIFALAAAGFCLSGWNLAGERPQPWAWKLLYVCLSVLVAIAMVESIKYVFGRCRPELLFSQGEYGFTWFSGKYVRNSFPSGHTTRIFALCTALGLVYKRLAVPLLTLAFLVGVSRVFALKHYPSDVLAGMTLGILMACWVFVLWQKNMPGPVACRTDQAGEKRSR